jgi:SepF-like predicted cell division protein (DUF552 family)
MSHMRYRQTSQTKSIDATSLNQNLSIKTVSIHTYSQLEDLRENVGKEPIIVIAKIAPLVSKHPEAASKLVNELCLSKVENNYSVFRLGEERIVVVPHGVQVQGTLFAKEDL